MWVGGVINNVKVEHKSLTFSLESSFSFNHFGAPSRGAWNGLDSAPRRAAFKVGPKCVGIVSLDGRLVSVVGERISRSTHQASAFVRIPAVTQFASGTALETSFHSTCWTTTQTRNNVYYFHASYSTTHISSTHFHPPLELHFWFFLLEKFGLRTRVEFITLTVSIGG